MLWTFEKLMDTMFTKMSVSGSCEHFSPLNFKKISAIGPKIIPFRNQ
jgi:hypothetical protein